MPLSGEYAPSPVDYAREQADKYLSSKGTEATEWDGSPVIVLTTVGAKTGKLRKTPLMRVECGGQYAIVASATAAELADAAPPTAPLEANSPATVKPPAWYYNVKKNSLVELQDGPTARDYHAVEVFGGEKALWWERAIQAWPDYAAYLSKTGCEIPVFVLTPIG